MPPWKRKVLYTSFICLLHVKSKGCKKGLSTNNCAQQSSPEYEGLPLNAALEGILLQINWISPVNSSTPYPNTQCMLHLPVYPPKLPSFVNKL